MAYIHWPISYDIYQSLQASVVSYAHRLGDISRGLHALVNRIRQLSLPARITRIRCLYGKKIPINLRRHISRNACIKRGVCAVTGQHLLLPAQISQE